MTPEQERVEREAPKKYQTRPETVEAIQWTGKNLEQLAAFLGECLGPIERRMDYKPRINGKNDANHYWIDLDRGDYVYKDDRGFHATKERWFFQKFEGARASRQPVPSKSDEEAFEDDWDEFAAIQRCTGHPDRYLDFRAGWDAHRRGHRHSAKDSDRDVAARYSDDVMGVFPADTRDAIEMAFLAGIAHKEAQRAGDDAKYVGLNGIVCECTTDCDCLPRRLQQARESDEVIRELAEALDTITGTHAGHPYVMQGVASDALTKHATRIAAARGER